MQELIVERHDRLGLDVNGRPARRLPMHDATQRARKVCLERYYKAIVANRNNGILNHLAVHRQQLLQAALNPLSYASQGLAGLHQSCTGVAAHVPLLVDRAANFTQQNTKIGQSVQTAGHEQLLMRRLLCVTTQTLHTLQTRGNIEKLRCVEIKSVNRGRR